MHCTVSFQQCVQRRVKVFRYRNRAHPKYGHLHSQQEVETNPLADLISPCRFLADGAMRTKTPSFATPPLVCGNVRQITWANVSTYRCPRPVVFCCTRKPTTHFIETSDGGRLCVDIYSPINTPKHSAQKPRTVLLIHDFMTDRRLFNRLGAQRALSQCTLLAPDLRGFGQSSNPTSAYSRSDDLVTVIHALAENTHVDVIGSGMGGAIALELALACPSVVHSICVAASGLPGHTWTSISLFLDISAAQLAGRFFRIIEEVAATDDKRRTDMTAAMYAAVSLEDADPVTWKRRFIAANPAWSDIVKRGRKDIARDLLRMARDYSAFHFFHEDPYVPRPFDGNPLFSRLAHVLCPVLTVVGKNDMVDFKTMSREICERVPRSSGRVITIDDCGHFAVLEYPEVVTQHLKTFWDTLKQSQCSSDDGKKEVNSMPDSAVGMMHTDLS